MHMNRNDPGTLTTYNISIWRLQWSRPFSYTIQLMFLVNVTVFARCLVLKVVVFSVATLYPWFRRVHRRTCNREKRCSFVFHIYPNVILVIITACCCSVRHWRQSMLRSIHGSGWKLYRSLRCCLWDPRSKCTTGKLHSIMPTWENMRFSLCPVYMIRGKSGPALGGTEYRLMPSTCRLIVRAKLWNLQVLYLVSRAPMRRRSRVVV